MGDIILIFWDIHSKANEMSNIKMLAPSDHIPLDCRFKFTPLHLYLLLMKLTQTGLLCTVVLNGGSGGRYPWLGWELNSNGSGA